MRLVDVMVIGVLLLPGLGVSDGACSAAGPQRPNVVLIIADDLAWDDCGAYGNPKVRTPHIDRLAREGLRFDRAFVTASSCSPSRSSLLTGRYPHNTGAEELHWPLPPEPVMFPRRKTTLYDSGIRALLIALWPGHIRPGSRCDAWSAPSTSPRRCWSWRALSDLLGSMRRALSEWVRETGDALPEVLSPDEFDPEIGELLPNRVPPRPTKRATKTGGTIRP